MLDSPSERRPRPSVSCPAGVWLLPAVALTLACGYRFTAGGGPLPGNARTLHVPVFKNLTAEPGLEGAFTEAFRDELSRWGREGGEASDATALGEIVEVSEGPAIVASLYSDAGHLASTSTSYRVQARIVVKVVRAGEQLAETTVTGTEDYLPSRPDLPAKPGTLVLEMEANRRLALRRLATSLMRQAYQNLTGF
ncbi:MAG: hypothetical protein HY901_07745 [Deltaproteobacteria bacterium]|nr:hypothetical protein [Deltaproteobacteria bacterium]